MSKNEPAWSVPLAVDDIDETGLHKEIEAPADARVRLAQAAGLRELPRLTAIFDLTRQGERVHLTGHVSATVGQTCVVTLEPIDSTIDEAVDLVFAPPGAAVTKKEEPPEPLVGGIIDLGAVAAEFLLLGIDPYPRKAGAKFAPPPAGEQAPNPFAVLEALKNRPGSKQS